MPESGFIPEERKKLPKSREIALPRGDLADFSFFSPHELAAFPKIVT
jgi:hypothetical protein